MLFFMRRKALLFLFIAYYCCSPSLFAWADIQIMETKDTYVVTAVQVVGSAESQGEAADNALRQARAVAYNHLAAALDMVKLDDVTIESIVISFSPGGLQLHDNGYYNALYDIVFDKRYLEGALLKKQLESLHPDVSGHCIKVQFEANNVLHTWSIIKQKLEAAKIEHAISMITSQYVILSFCNCNQDTLYVALRNVGIRLVQNQDHYFGKLSFFSR